MFIKISMRTVTFVGARRRTYAAGESVQADRAARLTAGAKARQEAEAHTVHVTTAFDPFTFPPPTVRK